MSATRTSLAIALLRAARAFVEDAVPLKDEFIRHDMPDSFIEDLREKIADLQRAMDGQNTGRDTRLGYGLHRVGHRARDERRPQARRNRP